MRSIKLSVHELVDFVLRTGDIDKRFFNRETMLEGSKIHQQVQSNLKSNALIECDLKNDIYFNNDYIVSIYGKADIIYDLKTPIIEEIKSTNDDINRFKDMHLKWHLGQAEAYAYLFLLERDINDCIIRINYISQKRKKESFKLEFSYNLEQLKSNVFSYIEYYIHYLELYEAQFNIFQNTISSIAFPYKNLRKGQKEFMVNAYEIATKGGIKIIEAPTGIGKTISSIYPFLKSLVNTDIKKVFYLTAKNTGKIASYQTLNLLVNNGLKINAITITAKEKMCINSKKCNCNPVECPFAKDYYLKLHDVIDFVLNKDCNLLGVEETISLGRKFLICPFELSLDLSNYMTLIVADYNYLFDPIVFLERYFNSSNNFLVLIDEVHNLNIRASAMYSETLNYSLFKQLKYDYRLATNTVKKNILLLEDVFKKYLNDEQFEKPEVIEDFDYETVSALSNLSDALKNYNDKHTAFAPNNYSIDFINRLYRFLILLELKRGTDITYTTGNKTNSSLNFLCLDPSIRIRTCLEKVYGSLLFSGTVSPIEYYQNVLGIKDTEPLILDSPFDKKHLKILIGDLSIMYKDREKTFDDVLNYINEFVSIKKGNYLIFTPSYEYLALIKKVNGINGCNCYFQEKEMSEEERIKFINLLELNTDSTNLFFTVVGGSFSESIDLKEDSLKGIIVIGVGMSKISFTNDLLKDYYNSIDYNGFNFSYKYPGINKVLQSIGRLIRRENDVGAVFLIDNRYKRNEYLNYFKNKSDSISFVNKKEDIKNILISFYKNVK